MEIKRAVYTRLQRWKEDSKGSTALLIEGARRIGKSTIAEKFARESYRSHIIIDFATASKVVKDNFEDNLTDLDRFFQIISLEYGTRLFPRESLIVFDEVQKFPKARESIKYLVADGRYDFIETGSLISIRENVGDIIVPSEEERLRMYPPRFRSSSKLQAKAFFSTTFALATGGKAFGRCVPQACNAFGEGVYACGRHAAGSCGVSRGRQRFLRGR